MVRLYHYTDFPGKVGIYADKLIRATDSDDGLGKVVRFTELDKTTDRSTLIENNWGDHAPRNAAQKLMFWFWFESDDLPAGTEKLTTVGTRNVWICPADVPLRGKAKEVSRSQTIRRLPLQSNSDQTVLYHYTDEAGKNAIHADGVIKAVRPHGGKGHGANMPVAVYFTEIIPTASKEDLMFNMYGTREVAKHADWLERTRFWFKFDAKDLPNVYKRTTRLGRNEWVCKEDVRINWSTLLGSSSRQPSRDPARTAPAGKIFYHYTDTAGRDDIMEKGYIAPKFSFRSLRSVVRFTDVPPSADKRDIVWHVFGKSPATPDTLDKIKYWFKFDQSELRDMNRMDLAGRDVWETTIAVLKNRSNS